MATRIKMNTIDAQIAFIDGLIEEATGIDLRQRAQNAINKREALRGLGKVIAGSIGFDVDNAVVLVAEKNYDIIH